MNLQQLGYVRTLAELESFGRAAKKCGVTQPTLRTAWLSLRKNLAYVFLCARHAMLN